MKTVTLGKTGLQIAPIGFGGIPIQRITAEETVKLFDLMIEKGINYLDTARGYTVSESYIGEAIKGRRDKFVLATKSMSRDYEGMKRDIGISLNNLQTNYIDLYQVHNPNMEQLEAVCAEGGALSALLEAKENGLIGHIGITAHSLAVFEKALDLPWVETIMFPYNIVETQGRELIARCLQQNIGFIAMKPLAGGAIEDGSIAMRYLLADPAVSVIIPGMQSAAEVEQNVAAAENNAPLSADEIAKIEEIRASLDHNFCRRCNYCAPCTVGINIPSVFLFAGYLERYGLEDWAKDRYNSMPVTASACIECGVCETRCPYELPIRKMLKTAAEEFGK